MTPQKTALEETVTVISASKEPKQPAAPVAVTPLVNPNPGNTVPQQKPTQPGYGTIVPTAPAPEFTAPEIAVGTKVLHKKFGAGSIAAVDKSMKYIHVTFAEGEKKFVYPDCFKNHFLEIAP